VIPRPPAGLGPRFLPLTQERPEEMLPVVDRPEIHGVVEEAMASDAGFIPPAADL